MVRVRGHWRSTGWVQGHLRHPHRPGADQFGLVVLASPWIRFDAARWAPDGDAPWCALSERPDLRIPRPRPG